MTINQEPVQMPDLGHNDHQNQTDSPKIVYHDCDIDIYGAALLAIGFTVQPSQFTGTSHTSLCPLKLVRQRNCSGVYCKL